MIELYAIRRGGYENETVKALIRHGVLIPILVTVTQTLLDESAEDDIQSKPAEVDWTGGSKR